MLLAFKRSFGLLAAVTACCCAGAGDELKPFDTVKDWGQVIDPVGDCSFSHDGNQLTIKVPGEYHDLWPGGGKVNAPLVLQDVEGDFSITVAVAHIDKSARDTRIAGLAGTTSFHAASLVIWQDAKNFIRFDRTQMDRSGQQITSCYLHIFKDGARVAELAPVVPDQPTQLRLTRRADSLTAAYSQDGGKSWKDLAPQKIDLPAHVKAGISALNNTTRGNMVTFEGLKIEK
jgi:regulation of enolase protein 1 (concanavalin A-like superfamily)